MAFRNPDNTQQKKNHFDIMDNNSTPLTLPDGQFFFFIIIIEKPTVQLTAKHGN